MITHNRKAKLELLFIAAVAITFAVLELYVDSFERFLIWATTNESLLVTEFVTLAVILTVGLSIYAWRRWREAIVLEADKMRLQQTIYVEQDANQLMRSYAEAVTQGQEAERMRLARELHDDTIQRLILLNQKIELASFDFANSRAAPALSEMQLVLTTTIDHVRDFIHALRPTYLDELGLTPALAALIKETREHTDLLVEFVVEGDVKRLGEATELALYRITQSALSNAVQHADASMISVDLRFSAENLSLAITDDGIGFGNLDERTLVKTGHYGLIGMRERAELLGATYNVESTPDDGTTVSVSINALSQAGLDPKK